MHMQVKYRLPCAGSVVLNYIEAACAKLAFHGFPELCSQRQNLCHDRLICLTQVFIMILGQDQGMAV